MNQLQNLEKLSKAPFYSLKTLRRVYNISENSLNQNIKRWLKQEELIQLKRGMYVNATYINALSPAAKKYYTEYIANTLKTPSYLSTEYVLQKYGILTESVFALTSISLKKPNIYTNTLGTFIYSNIKRQLFIGFSVENLNGYEILVASKAKALFDFLYLRLYNKPRFDAQTILEYRLNLDEFGSKDAREFKKYCELAKSKKFQGLPKILEEAKQLNDTN